MTRLRQVSLASVLAACSLGAAAQVNAVVCGELLNAFGPFDYRNADTARRGLVERPHFPPHVEALLRGNSGTIGAELDYTLRVFPNHPRALNAVMRYGEKMKSPQPNDLRYPVECYFERALRFLPEDHIARMLYAQFLQRNKRAAEAAHQLALVADKAADNAFTHFNLGLLYLDLDRPADALRHAHEAYALGFLRPQLRERLQSAGKWSDPPARAASAPPPAAADTTRRVE